MVEVAQTQPSGLFGDQKQPVAPAWLGNAVPGLPTGQGAEQGSWARRLPGRQMKAGQQVLAQDGDQLDAGQGRMLQPQHLHPGLQQFRRGEL